MAFEVSAITITLLAAWNFFSRILARLIEFDFRILAKMKMISALDLFIFFFICIKISKTGQDGKGLLQLHLWFPDDLPRLWDRIE